MFSEISVRSEPVGGSVVPVRTSPGSDGVSGNGAIVLLIHGYNTPYQDAKQSYTTFLNHLEKLGATVSAPIFGFFWPGDESNSLLSTISYPAQIRTAIDSAEQLFNYLQARTGPNGAPILISIVAHSLGNRVALEFLQRVASAAPPRRVIVDSIVLMAAAVPVGKVDSNDPLRRGATSAAHSSILFSTGDKVLHWAFPPGETAAGDGFFPTAIGREGGPSRTWQATHAMSDNGKQYDHSNYWCGTSSATEAALLLGVPIAPATLQNGAARMSLPPANAIQQRVLPTRQVG